MHHFKRVLHVALAVLEFIGEGLRVLFKVVHAGEVRLVFDEPPSRKRIVAEIVYP